MRSRTKGAIVALVAVTAMLAIPSAQSLPGGIAGVQQADAIVTVQSRPIPLFHPLRVSQRATTTRRLTISPYLSRVGPARRGMSIKAGSICGQARAR